MWRQKWETMPYLRINLTLNMNIKVTHVKQYKFTNVSRHNGQRICDRERINNHYSKPAV